MSNLIGCTQGLKSILRQNLAVNYKDVPCDPFQDSLKQDASPIWARGIGVSPLLSSARSRKPNGLSL